MTPKIFFLYARVAVVAAICGLLATARYSLSAIFTRGFLSGDELPLVDNRLLLVMIGGAALGLGVMELVRFACGLKIRVLKKVPLRVLARERIRPKFGF